MSQKSLELWSEQDAWCIELKESHMTLWLAEQGPTTCSSSNLEAALRQILSRDLKLAGVVITPLYEQQTKH